MKRKFISTIILSLALVGTNCTYAEEVISQRVDTQEIIGILDESDLSNKEVVTTEESTEESLQEDLDEQVDMDEQEVVEDLPSESQEKENITTESEENSDSIENPISEDLLNKVILTLDSKVVLVDGKEIILSTAPKVINNTTLLPLRFVAEQVIGAQVDWNSESKEIIITKNGTQVVLANQSKIIKVNGVESELLTEPIIDNNVTLVPLRFISEVFDIRVDFDNQTKKIIIDKSNKQQAPIIPNQAPVASFYFPQRYVAGQQVMAINTSIDPDGDPITEQLWKVLLNDKQITNKELSNMFKTPNVGTYVIGLQVKDSKGLWSDWAYETITIEANKAPIITDLTSDKLSYAQGEKIVFNYTYDNESWEQVKEGKWTYRKSTEPVNRATVGKPDVLFTEGEYIITLYLDDAYGNRSQAVETNITVTSEVLNTELNYRFTQGSIGDWIDNFQNDNYLNYTPVTIENTTYDYGTLIMSDSPENVTGQGILYRDKINGKGAILMHHINTVTNTTEEQRLALIVENPTSEPVKVILKNKSIKGPETDILRVGQLILNEYLSGKNPQETIILEPGERKYIYNKKWTVNTCISAHIDVETTGEVVFTVANLGKNHTLDELDTLYYFPADGVHYSGTYGATAINYEINLKGEEAERLLIGVNGINEWIVGYDERTNTPVENKGNFGIPYKITVTAQEDIGVILNNRGGTFQGAVKWNHAVYNMPGKGSFSGTTTKAVVMGVIKKGETVTIEYILPNGSAAPTLIGFIPKSQW